MTAKCPGCGIFVELGIAHQGVNVSTGLQRVVIEATHPLDDRGAVCADWATTELDLVALARTAA